MKIFDLHCDTISECCANSLTLYDNNLHFALNRTGEYDLYTQVFAVWIPDELRGSEAAKHFRKVSDYFYKEIENNKNIISMYGSECDTRVKAILSVEGGSACGGTIEGLKSLHKKGVKIITLTWNSRNEIAGGAFADGGFTDFGKEFVKTAEKLGIILDVSHLNKESFFEFADFATKPFIASHSNADIVDNPKGKKRNLTDEQIKIIKSKNGLIGLNYYVDFIENIGVHGVDALAEQIKYFINLGCENIIALGSDYDGCRIHNELSGVEKLSEVYKELLLRGFDENLLYNLFYGNAERFFSKNIK